jgi:hypothetical protein
MKDKINFLRKKYKGIWFYGISGSGKTYLSIYLKSRIFNSLVLDGDEVRKNVSFDLSYSIKDRVTQTKRMFGFAKICIKNKIFPIISTVYLNNTIYNDIKKKKILVIKITRKKNLTNKKFNLKTNDVVGIGIPLPNLKCKSLLNKGESFVLDFLKLL